MAIRILLADDHVVMRQGLRTLLQTQPEIEVIGEADDGRAAVRLARELRPQVIIMDIAMEGLNGVEATRQVLADNPEVRVLALSMHSEKQYVSEMLAAGAAGYLLKNSPVEELIRAINVAIGGRIYLSPSLVELVVEDYAHRLQRTPDSEQSQLTPREREILQLVAEGKSTKEIADGLNVSISTVNTHRQQIMRKLNIKNAVELARYAIRAGLAQL